MEADEDTEETAVDFNLAMDSFVKYVEGTWVGAKGRNGVRKRPKFDRSIWNHYNTIMEDSDDTTNKSEAWNSASKHCMVMKPSIWSVLSNLKKEEEFARSKIQSVTMGTLTDTHAGRTAKRVKKRASLKAVVEKFGTISTKEWMDMIISYYNDELE